MSPPVPAGEDARLAALRDYRILDTAADPEFDDLAELARTLCDTPKALVSFVDADRQWFKAGIGIDRCESAREHSFCAHAINGAGLMVVPDAAADPRFHNNPFVTGTDNIRFYAGAPLVTPDGHALGALCVVDTVPRDLTPRQARALEALARQAVCLLELRLATRLACTRACEREEEALALRGDRERLRLAFRTAQMAIWDWDPAHEAVMFADEVWGLLGGGPDGFPCTRGAFLASILPDDREEVERQIRRGVGGGAGYHVQFRVAAPEGGVRWVAAEAVPQRGSDGTTVLWHGVLHDVTQLKQAERALKQSEEWLQAIVTHAPVILFMLDRDGVFTACEGTGLSALGLRPGELVGRSAFDMLANMPDVVRHLRRALKGEAFSASARFPSLTLETWYTPLFGADGAVSGLCGVSCDVTERVRAEAEAEASREMLRSVMDSIPQCIFWKDRNSVYRGCNRNFALAAGLSDPKDVVGRTDFDLPWTPEEAEAYRAMDRHVMDTDTAEYRIVGTQRQSEGGEALLETNKMPLHDAAGRVVGILGTYENVTKRRRTEEELRRSRSRLSSVIESAMDAIITVDARQAVLDFNPAAERLFGYAAEEIFGRPLTVLLPERFRRGHESHVRAFSRSGETARRMGALGVLSGRRRDGTEFPIEVTISQLDGEGETLFTAIVRDVTEREAVEQALVEARDQALASTRAKSAFLANMSHEIRTPMNGILGMTRLLLASPLTSTQVHHAQAVQRSAEGLLDIINDVLDVSKIEAGKMTLDVGAMDLREVIEGVVDLLAPRAHEKGLELACLMPPDFPHRLRGDAARLRQILTNLVANAIKFTPAGEVMVAARVLGQTPAEVRLRLSVRDTGVGIPPDRWDAIFDSFAQADSGIARRFGGTGLGLAICRQLVQMMGGRISVESQAGMGSEFHVTLVLERQQEAAADVVAPGTALGVLIVESNEAVREMLAAQCRSWGRHVIEVSTVDECLGQMRCTAATLRPLGVALISLPLIEQAGVAESVSRAARLGGVVPVLLISGGGDGPPEALRRLGYEHCLAKPVRQSTLYDALARAMGGLTAPPATGGAPAGTIGRRLGLRVLLAEDNLINQEVAVATLESWGCRVDVAQNGRQALEALDRQPYDVILMDVQMPEMDGLEATSRIRAGERGTGRRQIIVAMTAHNMQGDREQCLAAGMDGYAGKPIDPQELFAILARCRDARAPESAPAAPGRGVPVLDFERLGRSCLGKPFLERRVMAEALRLLPDGLDRLAAAVLAGQAEATRFEAHALRGTCRTLGAEELGEVCAGLEQMARGGGLGDAPARLAEARSAWTRLRSALEGALDREPWRGA